MSTLEPLYCACDAGRLLVLAPPSCDVLADLQLAGAPEVIFLDAEPRTPLRARSEIPV